MVEIERRFLCTYIDEKLLARATASEISQGYLTETGPTVRVRRRDEEYLLTIKSGSGLVRREVEVEIPEDAGRELMDLAGEHRLEKTRYQVDRWEIDQFHGKLNGLVLVEIELEHLDEPTPPPPPGLVLGREVTLVPGFTNGALASLTEELARSFVARTLDQNRIDRGAG